MSTSEIPVDVELLHEEIRRTYTDVSTDPSRTSSSLQAGPGLASSAIPGLEPSRVPDATVESFAGVANYWTLRRIEPGSLDPRL